MTHTDSSHSPQEAIDKAPSQALLWLDSFGSSLGLGLVILSSDGKIMHQNSQFASHCALPDEFAKPSKYFEDCLEFMSHRGDFGDRPVKDVLQAYQDQLAQASGAQVVTLIQSVKVPSGKLLDIKLLPGPNGATVIVEDHTSESRSDHVLCLVSEIGECGFFYGNFEDNSLDLTSSYLKTILTEPEYASVRKEGLWALMHPDDIPPIRQKWREALSQKKIFCETLRLLTKNKGTVWMRVQTHFDFQDDGKADTYLCHFKNVTESLRVLDELRKSKEKLESSLKSKTNFIARISHEIRTPMNAVIGIADALIHYNDNPAIVPKLELIQSSAGNILNILDDTLDHSKLDSDSFSLNPVVNNPRETLEHLAELWRLKAEKTNTKIICHIDDNVPEEMIFDRFRLEQCVNNLLSNAIKFTPNGTVSLIGGKTEKDGKDHLIVAVKDTGIGMSEEQKARVFVPFQQGDSTISSRYGGTGLGMAITMQIVELMNGRITVKSKEGEGTIFALIIPIKYNKVVNPTSGDLVGNLLSESQEKTAPYARLNVLVADDNPTNHMVVKSMLGPIVNEIITVENGKEAIEVLERQPIDVILMDIHMPVMDGVEATLAIRSSGQPWSDILIIAVTADPEYQQHRMCINLGMDFALAKPLKLALLLNIFDTHLLGISEPEALKKTG